MPGRHVNPARYLGVVDLATDVRLQQTSDPACSGVENQVAYAEAPIVGGMQASLGIVYDEESLFARLAEIRADFAG